MSEAMSPYTIIQMPGSLGRRGAENGVIIFNGKAGSILLQGERIHGETLTIDVECSSGKDAYPTYAAAEKALRMKSRNGQRTKRIYRCEECGYYHFTTNDGTARKPRPYRREKEKKYARQLIAPFESHSEPVTSDGFSMKRFQNTEYRLSKAI